MGEYNVNMIKNKDKKKDVYHADPRNDIEKFLVSNLPIILDAHGINKISFYMVTKSDCDDDTVMFSIVYSDTYKTASVTIHTLAQELFKRGEFATVLNGFVHEISHILTNKLGELALNRHSTKREIRDSVEELTETIAQIVRVLLSKTHPKIFN